MLGLPGRWLVSSINKAVSDLGLRSQFATIIPDECELCHNDLYFPHFIAKFKSEQSLNTALHQLRGDCAAALASGIPWIGYSHCIFGLIANSIIAKLFIAWMEPSNTVQDKKDAVIADHDVFYMSSMDVFNLEFDSGV